MIFTKCCETGGTWDPTFTAKGSPLIVLIPLLGVLALYIWMTLRTRGAWLIPTLRIVSRRENPAAYWAAIIAAALALTIVFAATAYAVCPQPIVAALKREPRSPQELENGAYTFWYGPRKAASV